MLESKAVICRSLSIVQYVLSSDTALYGTYYQQVHAGVRLPEDNSWDRGRASVDNTLFPNFADQIVFAALSLDGRGLTSFGSYAIVLKEAMIHHRASVFEENPFRFVRRHRVVVGDPIPTGYRAAWGRRGELALAKLHSRLGPATTPDDFAGMLMAEGTCSSDEDFIEVHIFGPIHRRAVERVIGPPPRHGERALMKSIERKLAEVGAILETR